jgi:hypothetical protein
MEGLVHTSVALVSVFCFFSRLPPFLVTAIVRVVAIERLVV